MYINRKIRLIFGVIYFAMNSFRRSAFLIFVVFLSFQNFSFSQSSFRIFPYLQVADQNLIQIRWFGDQNYSSSISIKDSKGVIIASENVLGVEIPEFYYTSVEKSEVISGLEGQNWIGGDKYFKYEFSFRVPIGEVISYEVLLNGQSFTNDFKSAPDPKNWETIRFIALSDSETEPRGRVTNRAWYPGQPLIRFITVPALWKKKFGTTTEEGFELPNYFLTETQGYSANLEIINDRNPNFMLMPGDLVQGGGYMPAWDEFWRHNAGQLGSGLSSYPIIPAIGNWENFGALNNGYGTNEKGQFNPLVGRSRFHSFFEIDIEDPLQKHRQSYYRTDYGPITILTLDSSNGTPDQKRLDFSDDQKLKNKEFSGPGTDTQENFTQAQYTAAGGSDLSGFGPGTAQYLWLEENLKSASEAKKMIFVQFHHISFSSGEHGVPMNHELSTGQGGTPMRIIHPLLEEYGVIAVIAGHDELFERSFVDQNGDGKGVHYYDVGVAGDGLRGVKRNWFSNPLETLDYNEFSKWTADQKSLEQWNTTGSNPVLSDGGKHYGHLEVNLKKVKDGAKTFAQIDFEPIYAFPVMDQNYNLQRIERRVYNDPLRILVELEEEPIEPIFKESITVELDENGEAITTINDYLENEPLEEWDVEFSNSPEYSCPDIAGTENQITITDSAGNIWSEVVQIIVLDKIPPDFEATDANLPFDKTIGKVVIDIGSFYIRTESIFENCLIPFGVSIDLSISEITCSDFNPDGSYEPKSVSITMTDRSGNSTTKIRKVNLNVFESKKVSLTPIESVDGQPMTITLGDELVYTVKNWVRFFNGETFILSDQTGKSLFASLPGTYYAVLNLDSGCEVRSEEVYLDIQIQNWPTLKPQVNLILDESGTAILEPEDLFENWPIDIEGLIFDLSKRDFSCENIGENDVKLTLKKSDGETKEFFVIVVVEDKSAPILITKVPDLAFDLIKGELVLKPEDFVSSLTDNCGVKSLELNKTKITCEDYDMPIELILTAIDNSGNSTSVNLIVSASPFESKKISISPESGTQFVDGQTAEIRLGEEFGFTLIGWYRNGQLIEGEKGKAILTELPGTYWATLISNDGGCVVESNKTEIKFTSLPYGEVKESITLTLGSEGKADLGPSNVFVSWPLADPTLEITLSKTIFACEEIGEKEVGILIKNQAGQTWEESIKVIVKDQTVPTLIPKNIILNLDVSKGSIEITPEQVLAEYGDNCGIKSLTISTNNFTCEDTGKEFSITIRAEDNSGNVIEAISTVKIERFEAVLVALDGSSSFCAGESGVLELTSSSSFEVVRWRRNGAEIQGQTGKILEVIESGVYHAVIRYEGGCLSESEEFEVKVNALPEGEIEVDGNILRAPDGDYTYQWFRNGEKLENETSRTFTTQLMGEYYVELTSTAGCTTDLEAVTLTISGLLSRPVKAAKELKIYPNPASDRVTLELSDGVLASKPTFTLYSSDGKNVTSAVQISILNETEVEILLNRLAKGTYLVWVIGQNQDTYYGKLVILN